MKENLDKRGLTRRKMLGLTAAAGVTAGAAILANEFRGRSPEKAQEEGFEFLNVSPHPRTYATGHLEHHKFSPRLTQITGIVPVAPQSPEGKKKGPRPEPRIPHEANVDFSFQLAGMWKEKVRLMGPKAGIHRAAIKDLFSSYHPDGPEKPDLASYRARISGQIETARKEVPLQNIKHLEAFQHFTQEQVELVSALERRIMPTSLLAYSLTELMPTSGAEAHVGVQVYDWLLQNAGLSYLENGVPAQADTEFSFGPYQLTPGTLINEKNALPAGARLIEELAPESARRLPADLGNLRGQDQHRAAYLFAVHNLALLVRRLKEVRSQELTKYLSSMPADLVPEFIAASHHNPAKAMNAFEEYLYKYHAAVQEPDKYGKPDFVACCEPEGDLGPYARKTRDNFAALRSLSS